MRVCLAVASDVDRREDKMERQIVYGIDLQGRQFEFCPRPGSQGRFISQAVTYDHYNNHGDGNGSF